MKTLQMMQMSLRIWMYPPEVVLGFQQLLQTYGDGLAVSRRRKVRVLTTTKRDIIHAQYTATVDRCGRFNEAAYCSQLMRTFVSCLYLR